MRCARCVRCGWTRRAKHEKKGALYHCLAIRSQVSLISVLVFCAQRLRLIRTRCQEWRLRRHLLAASLRSETDGFWDAPRPQVARRWAIFELHLDSRAYWSLPHSAYVSHVAHSYTHTETLFLYDSCKSMPSFLSAGDARGIVARGRHRSCSSQLTSIAMNLYTYRLSMLIADAPSASDCVYISTYYIYSYWYSDGGNL